MFKTSRENVEWALCAEDMKGCRNTKIKIAFIKSQALEDLLTAYDVLEWKEFDAEDKGTWPDTYNKYYVTEDEKGDPHLDVWSYKEELWVRDCYEDDKTVKYFGPIPPPQIEEKT